MSIGYVSLHLTDPEQPPELTYSLKISYSPTVKLLQPIHVDSRIHDVRRYIEQYRKHGFPGYIARHPSFLPRNILSRHVTYSLWFFRWVDLTEPS